MGPSMDNPKIPDLLKGVSIHPLVYPVRFKSMLYIWATPLVLTIYGSTFA